ncbi:XRE family transcriptional regulator [Leptospira interrogans]|uniref:XRE family transcriptional regulator n=1 Tax=Leptospira interrogans TaxID=173 RepID=UPI001F116198|nr:XRE family transcriptional regulator [Leptospira interrogans]UMQ60526.1 XRE family transcriptional regulator [Leptospira interrogans]
MKNIHDVITNRKNCLRSEAEEKEYLIDYIRKFVDAKRGNQKLLAEASSIPQNKISSLIRERSFSPGMDTIIKLAETIQNIQ